MYLLSCDNQTDIRILISNGNLQKTMSLCPQGSEKNNLKLVYKCENKIKICIRIHKTRNVYLDFFVKKNSKGNPCKTKKQQKFRERHSDEKQNLKGPKNLVFR